MNRYNLKDVMDFAAAHYPMQTKQAVLKTFAKMRGKKRLGDATDSITITDWQAVADAASNTDVFSTPSPTGSVVFNTSGQVASPPAVLVPSPGTSAPPASISDTIAAFVNNITSSVPDLLTAYTANKQLDACSKTNQARLSAGLSPVDCSSFAPTANVGFAPGTQKMLTYALLGGGALVLFAIMSRRHA